MAYVRHDRGSAGEGRQVKKWICRIFGHDTHMEWKGYTQYCYACARCGWRSEMKPNVFLAASAARILAALDEGESIYVLDQTKEAKGE